MATLTIATTEQQLHYRPGDLEHAIAAGYAELARQVVKLAIRDAMSNPDSFDRYLAAEWLTSEDGQNMAEWSGFDSRLIRRWVEAGCPKRKKD